MRLGDTACRTLAAVLTLHARNGRGPSDWDTVVATLREEP